MPHQVKIFKPNKNGDLKLKEIVPANIPDEQLAAWGWRNGTVNKWRNSKSSKGGLAGSRAKKNNNRSRKLLETGNYNKG